MHGIDLTTQMDIFYHAMNYASEGIIDASCCGAFKRRNAEEAWQLIEDLAKYNYKALSEASGSSNRLKGSGLIGLDRMTAIEAKLDAVMNKLGSNERRMYTAHEVGAVEERIKRSAEELVGEEPYQIEETEYMSEQRSYHFKPNPNFPTHYTPALSAHAMVAQQTHIQVKCLHECHMSCMKCHHAHIPSHSPTASHMHMASVKTLTGITNDLCIEPSPALIPNATANGKPIPSQSRILSHNPKSM